MAREKYVDLKIRAEDQFSATLAKGKAALKGFADQTAKLDLAKGVQEARDSFTALSTQIRNNAQILKQAQTETGGYGQSLGDVALQNELLVNAVKKARVALDQKKVALQQIILAEKLAKNGTIEFANASRGSFSDFSKGADSASKTMERLRDRIVRTKAAQDAAAASARSYFQNQNVANRVGPGFGSTNSKLAQEQVEAVRRYKAELSDLDARIKRLTPSVRGSFLALSQKATQIGKTADAARTLSAETQKQVGVTNADDAAIKKLSRTTKALDDAQRRARGSIQGATAAIGSQAQVARGAAGGFQGGQGRGQMFGGESADVEMYGLRPYQMVNLGYQVNDVVSGLAMGQKPLQILAQQAGQIIQIWPQMMVGLVRGLPVLAGLSAAFAPIIVNMAALNRESQSMQQFAAQLRLMADGGNYTAENLAATTEAVRNLGVTTDQARKLVKGFVDTGLQADKIEEFAKAAKDLSTITGGELEETARQLSTGFSGGFDEISDLDKELKTFTATQYAAIRAMYEAGDAAGGQQMAFEILQENLSGLNQEAGPWAQAVGSLGGAWDGLLNLFKDSFALNFTKTVLDGLATAVQGVGAGVAYTMEALNWAAGGQTGPAPSSGMQEMAELGQEIRRIETDIANIQARLSQGLVADRDLAETNAYLATMRDRLDEIADRRVAIRDEMLGAPVGADGGLTAEQVEELKKRYDDFSTALKKTNEERAFETSLIGKSAQEIETETALREASALAAENGAESLDELKERWKADSEAIRIAIAAKYDAIAAEKELTDALRITEATAERMTSQRVKDNAMIAAEEAAIARLRQGYGDLSPEVRDAEHNLRQMKAGMNEATHEAQRLADAATELNRALSTLGSMELDLDSQIAVAARKLDMVARGYSEARILATERVNAAINDEIDTMFNQGMSIEAVAAHQANLIAKQERAIELQKEADEAFRNRFNPPAERSSGAGRTGPDPQEEERKRLEQEMNDILQYRVALLEAIEFFTSSGQTDLAAKLVPELELVNAQSRTAIDNMEAFLRTLASSPEIEAALLNLGQLRRGLEDVADEAITTGEEMNTALSGGLASGAMSWVEALMAGENAIKSLGEAFRKFASDFLMRIAQLILEQAFLNALQAAGGTGGIGGSVARVISSVFHDGGLVSGGGASRVVPASIFAGATRYHGGGGPRLRPNEVPAILEDDEEVLTRTDPRHQLNGGGQGGGGVLKIELSAGLEARILNQAKGQTMQIVEQNNTQLPNLVNKTNQDPRLINE